MEGYPGESGTTARATSRCLPCVERSDAAFQRRMSRAKVSAIRNFHETAESQPPIPAAILLFTHERLAFDPLGQ